MRLMGIDGCRGGWAVATADERLAGLHFAVVGCIHDLMTQVKHEDCVAAIDVPIGLPSSECRVCDIAARRALGPRQGSRVFPAPCRAAITGSTYRECCDSSRKASGKAISKQTYAIIPKVRAVDAAITPALQLRVREAHPEISFSVLNGGPLQHSKKTVDGRQERLAVLARYGLLVDPMTERLRLGRCEITLDDVIDAAVCLLTAQRIYRGHEQVLGDGAVDRRGLRMEIVA